MTKYIIQGENIVSGEIKVMGAKNQAIKMFPVALLTDEQCIIHNMPDILDVKIMCDIVKSMGVNVEIDADTYTITPKDFNSPNLPADLVTQIRASFLYIFPLLHKYKEVKFPHPGGDQIGRRPIDMVLDFLIQMGASIKEVKGSYEIRAKELKGIDYTFKWISHTGSEAIIMASVLAKGESIIRNVALEPEVIELCNYLNSVGAKIQGIGTTTLIIQGVDKLNGGELTIIPDRIEAGTFAILGALCGDNLKITNINPNHLNVFFKYLELMNIDFKLDKNSLTISKAKNIIPQNVKTHEYPGFSTDLQPPMTLLLTQAKGQSIVHDTVYDGRLFYTDILNKIGANIIMADPHRVIIQGPSQFYGQNIASPDIRAGITLVLAGLIAEGETVISNVSHIQRGHANLIERLNSINAKIKEI